MKHFTAIVAIFFVLAWFSISPLVFFSNDTGLRYLQIRELIDQNWQTFAINYPTRSFDPELKHVPYYYAFSVVDGEIFLNISPFFPLLGSLLMAGLGTFGLAITPALGTLATVAGIYQLAKLFNLRHANLLMWLTGLGTPLFFYGLELWDHSWGTALVVWGLAAICAGVMRESVKWIGVGGFVLALAFGNRPETYLFAIVAGIVLALLTFPQWKKPIALATGGFMGAVIIWALQFMWVGHPFGMAFAPHFFGYGEPEYISYPEDLSEELQETSGTATQYKKGRLLFNLEARDPITGLATIFALVGAVISILALRIPKWQKRRWLLVGLTMSAIGYFIWGRLAWGHWVTGLITAMPLFGLAFTYVSAGIANPEIERLYKFIFLTTLGFVAGMMLLWPAEGGTQWGARYLMPAYPLMAFLAVFSYEHWLLQLKNDVQFALKTTFATLLAVSFIFQLLGVRLLFRTHVSEIAYRDQLQSLPANLILTSHPFMPSFETSLAEKQFMYVDEQADLEVLLSRFANAGITDVGLMTLDFLPLEMPASIEGFQIEQITPLHYQIRSR